MSNVIFLTIFMAIFGALMGSLLNMMIYRYPLMLFDEWGIKKLDTKLNFCTPRSHCPHCKKTICWWMNIPIISYLFLRGHCFYCKHTIGYHYFLTEIIASITSVIVYLHFGLSVQTIELLIFTYGLIMLSMIDLHHHILPDTITFILLWLGLIVSTQHIFTDPTQAIYGTILGYLFLWIIATTYHLLKKQEGLGMGDCKMMAMMGAWLGTLPLLNVILCASILALLISIPLVITKKIRANTHVPFGPFIAIAGWCTLLYGSFLVKFLY